MTSASKPTEIANLGITNVYTKTEVDAGLAEKAASSHVHGNINNDGTITSQAVTAATGVLVYDSTGKIQRATAAQTRAIIGAGTSSLTLAGSGSATTAAKSDHTHSGYEGQISALEGKLTDVSSTVGASITSAINGLTHTGTASSGKFVSAVTQSAGKVSVTYSSLPTASTSAAGIVQLDTTASTAAAGNHTHSGYESKFSNIESNYVRFNSTDSKLYIGESTTDTIIFDCGGAE